MNVVLPPDLRAFVERQVARGRYIAEVDVIEAALRRLRDEQERDHVSMSDLRRDIQKGIEQAARGEVYRCSTPEELDAFCEDINRRGYERLARERENADR